MHRQAESADETRTLRALALPARLCDTGDAPLRRALYVDCETTGLSFEHDQAIELAMLPFPECDAELLFSDIELRFLTDYAADAALPAPRNLAGAVLLVALLGGYQNRNHDPPPGHQIMWRGYERMSIATLGYRIAQRHRGNTGIVQNE